MNKDVVEILGDVQTILDKIKTTTDVNDVLSALEYYVQQKRLEFVEPQGDCI